MVLHHVCAILLGDRGVSREDDISTESAMFNTIN